MVDVHKRLNELGQRLESVVKSGSQSSAIHAVPDPDPWSDYARARAAPGQTAHACPVMSDSLEINFN